MTILPEIQRTFESIIARCEDGDRRTDWLPTVARLCREGIVHVAAAEAERDALRTAASEYLDAFAAVEGRQFCSTDQADRVDDAREAMREALASPGSGGPGVHLTAGQAETVRTALGAAEYALLVSVEADKGEALADIGRALALLRPAVRGGGQAATEEGER